MSFEQRKKWLEKMVGRKNSACGRMLQGTLKNGAHVEKLYHQLVDGTHAG